MNWWVFGLTINQLSWLHLHYLNVYGKGIPRNEEHSHPFWSMHQDLQDEKMGLKTFEDIRQAWGFLG